MSSTAATIPPAIQPRRRPKRHHLRLAVALPFATGLLSFGVGVYAYQFGRSEATEMLTTEQAYRVWSTPPTLWWLAVLTGFGALMGLAIALAFTHQLKTLARRTEFLARRNFSFPVELEADGEVAPLVDAINELLGSVRDYARRSVADGVISFSRSGHVLSINPRAAVALGVAPEEAIGLSYSELIPSSAANAPVRDALAGAVERSEPFDLKGLHWVNQRGQRLSVDVQGTVLAGDESIISMIVVFEAVPDIGRVQRQVSRAHRLMVIGGFAAELAHEVRNPLSSVCGLVELLHERLPEGDEGHRHLAVLSTAAGRIERLVSQLLDLVPTEIHDLERCDLSAIVRESVSFARIGELDRLDVELIESYGTGLPLCLVDPDRVSRAVENLVRNAYAHTPAGGTITIHTCETDDGEVEIEVANTGSYIPVERREQIFQPFVSGRSKGTGLGLAIAQQIAYGHGGSLEVESTEGGTTAFQLRVPAADHDIRRPLVEIPEQPLALAGAA